MHLLKGPHNVSIVGAWSAFLEDRKDNQTDNLPMMDSIAWPIGSCMMFKILISSNYQLSDHFRNWYFGYVLYNFWQQLDIKVSAQFVPYFPFN